VDARVGPGPNGCIETFFHEEISMGSLQRLVASVVVPILVAAVWAQEPVALKTAAPELKGIEAWINSKPLTLKELRGKVVVLHFWTFG
jgi:hypothetical protein